MLNAVNVGSTFVGLYVMQRYGRRWPLIIGGIGTAFGVTTGLALCTGLKWFGVRLNPEVYYIDRLPINVDPIDFLSAGVGSSPGRVRLRKLPNPTTVMRRGRINYKEDSTTSEESESESGFVSQSVGINQFFFVSVCFTTPHHTL